METKIKILKTNGISGLKIHEVGKEGVTEIRDNSMDTRDDSMDTPNNFVLQYLIYVDGKLKYSYGNGVYEIEYEV